MNEKRLSERKPYKEMIDFYISIFELGELKKRLIKAETVDINDSGLGFHTEYPLEPGHILMFGNRPSPKIGIVKWIKKLNDNVHRAGMKIR